MNQQAAQNKRSRSEAKLLIRGFTPPVQLLPNCYEMAFETGSQFLDFQTICDDRVVS